MNFGSHTDNVVLAAAALVNAVTPGERQGQAYQPPTGRELRTAITCALQQGDRRASSPAVDVPAFCAVARGVRTVFEAVGAGRADEAAAVVNALLERYRPTPRLAHHDGEPWHLHFHGRGSADRTGWGGGIAVGLATVLGGEYADRLGVCAANACDRVYVDVSRNGTRRFCSTACQNRVKAAAHRARAR